MTDQHLLLTVAAFAALNCILLIVVLVRQSSSSSGQAIGELSKDLRLEIEELPSMSMMIREELTSGILTSIGGLLARPAFDRLRQHLDPNEVGGAPLLGVNGVVIIGHGRSNAYAIKQAIGQARLAVEQDIVGAIKTGIEN